MKQKNIIIKTEMPLDTKPITITCTIRDACRMVDAYHESIKDKYPASAVSDFFNGIVDALDELMAGREFQKRMTNSEFSYLDWWERNNV